MKAIVQTNTFGKTFDPPKIYIGKDDGETVARFESIKANFIEQVLTDNKDQLHISSDSVSFITNENTMIMTFRLCDTEPITLK